jgi:hypothetical protein
MDGRRQGAFSTDPGRPLITMLYPQLELKMRDASYALAKANSANIIELCKQYLALLAEYRNQLYESQVTPRNDRSATLSSPVDEARKAIRAAIENTTVERNRIERLLVSFITVSGYEAVEIFNQRKYEGHDDWELRASGVKPSSGSGEDLMTIQQAVDTASLLRREDHIAQNANQSFKEGQA